tara:strand:+ start:103 stop:294 length:192 start_codon:yes stop_codon:yes gene_type:complete
MEGERMATYYVREKGKDKFGINKFSSLEDYKSWRCGLITKGIKLTRIYWQDGYPGLDGWNLNR